MKVTEFLSSLASVVFGANINAFLTVAQCRDGTCRSLNADSKRPARCSGPKVNRGTTKDQTVW